MATPFFSTIFFFFSWFSALLLFVEADDLYVKVEPSSLDTFSSLRHEFCGAYNPSWKKLTKTITLPFTTLPLNDSNQGCLPFSVSSSLEGKAVIVPRGACNFSSKAANVFNAGGLAMIIVNNDSSVFQPHAVNIEDYALAPIPVGLLSLEDGGILSLLTMDQVSLSASERPLFDANICVFTIFTLACILLASYLSHRLEIKALSSSSPHKREDLAAQVAKKQVQQLLTPKVVGFLVVWAACVLLLLYFFYKYIVYIVMFLFVLIGAVSMHQLLFNLGVFSQKGKYIMVRYVGPVFVSSLITLLCCFGITIWWLICRHESYIWVVQDLIGFCIIVSAIETIQLPSFKLATLLLFLFMLYDIFFVFITPLLTHHKESVMQQAATGGGSGVSEMIPVVVVVPRLSAPPCEKGYSMLGYGDVLIPGLFLNFLLGCDVLRAKTRPSSFRFLYFIFGMLSYFLGLVLTYVVLGVTHAAQPALVYLVPCTWTVTVFVALYQGELSSLWNGRINSSMSNGRSKRRKQARNGGILRLSIEDDASDSEEDRRAPSPGSTLIHNNRTSESSIEIPDETISASSGSIQVIGQREPPLSKRVRFPSEGHEEVFILSDREDTFDSDHEESEQAFLLPLDS